MDRMQAITIVVSILGGHAVIPGMVAALLNECIDKE
jgi:hypothetical protein